MARRRDDTATSVDAIFRLLIETIYGESEATAAGLHLLAEMLRRPLYLSGLAIWGSPEPRLLPDGQPDWNLPVEEIRSTLRRVLEHLAHWKRDFGVFGNGAAILQSGVAVRTEIRMSLGNDGEKPNRHLLAVQGPPKDVFLAVILMILAQGANTKILACPECHKVFFRSNRRQTHCGKQCYDRRYWRERYTPQQKATARRIQYDKRGWSLGAKGSALGQLTTSPVPKTRRRPNSRRKGE
jgi:hypothetical protein